MGDSLKELVYLIKERHSNYAITDDYRVDDDIIKSLCHAVRASLIRKEYNNKKVVSDSFYVRSCCALIQCEKEECTYKGETISVGRTQYYIEFPTLIEGVKPQVKDVGSKMLDKLYDYFNLGQFSALDERIYSKPMGYTIFNNKLYLKRLNSKGEKFLCYSALLYDPTKACDYNDLKPYPVPSASMLVEMVVRILKEDSGQYIDRENNASDETVISKKETKGGK